ncbi:MAG: POTRA domain-containing protein [Hydrogenophaga sp.]|nr:POTRA domain-containing protein [Hydrogenophaga sp.]
MTRLLDDVRAKNDAAAKADLPAVVAPVPGLLPQETLCFTIGHVLVRPEDLASCTFRPSALAMQAGEALNLRDIEQTSDNLRRLPGAAPTMEVVPGSEPGESALHIDLQPFKPWA